eukprot:2277308-Prymnesium_polylepis.1
MATHGTGRPCNFVTTAQPESIFGVPPNAVQDNILFQPLPKVEKNWQRFQRDSFMAGGTGPIPTLREYLRLLRSLRLERGRPVHVVQVGANLGGTYNSKGSVGRNDIEFNEWVHPLLSANPSWTGVVIEPTPKVFRKLSQNYARDAHRVQPMNLAIATYTGPCDFHINQLSLQTSTLALGEQVHGWRCNLTAASGCGFMRREMRRKGVQRITVNCSTLEDALSARRADLRAPVDLLVLDAEMFDYTLMRTIRFDRVRPLAIEFETKAMTMQQGTEIASLMALQGYLCRFEPPDDMLYKRRAFKDMADYGDGPFNNAPAAYNWSHRTKLRRVWEGWRNSSSRKKFVKRAGPEFFYSRDHQESVCFRVT